jgi:hypothetical protein
MITGWMVDMALLSRTVVSLGRPFEDGELIGKTALPDDLHSRLPPATSTSSPKRGHTTPADQPLQDGAASVLELAGLSTWVGGQVGLIEIDGM